MKYELTWVTDTGIFSSNVYIGFKMHFEVISSVIWKIPRSTRYGKSYVAFVYDFCQFLKFLWPPESVCYTNVRNSGKLKSPFSSKLCIVHCLRLLVHLKGSLTVHSFEEWEKFWIIKSEKKMFLMVRPSVTRARNYPMRTWLKKVLPIFSRAQLFFRFFDYLIKASKPTDINLSLKFMSFRAVLSPKCL